MEASQVLTAANPKLLINNFCERREIPAEKVLSRLISTYARAGQQEGALVELKESFQDDTEGWLKLERQLVGIGNSGGGIVIFGIDRRGNRVGLPNSLTAAFDPANLMQKLQRHASTASVPTAYVEVMQYGKRYGTLFIGPTVHITVFDKVGNVQGATGRSKAIFQQGVVYVRGEGTTREARQSDLDLLINERVRDGLTAFLARIERVAELPAATELLARSPGSDRGYVLVSGGQGVPVTIAENDDAKAVHLTEVLVPDAPLSSLDAEVVGQVRQWHADAVHRVPRETLMRWYLGRATFGPVSGRAKLCFLSAMHSWGYPMYWASQMDREDLRQTIIDLAQADAYPDTRALPYVIGAFFFSERAKFLDKIDSHLSTESAQVCQRLRDAPDASSYLLSGRLPHTTKVRIGGAEYALTTLMEERDTTAQTLFENLMSNYAAGNVPDKERSAAHQLDMMLHGDLHG
jgi:hypothetical protein